MIVHTASAVRPAYAGAQLQSPRQYLAASPADPADTVRISQAARDAFAASSHGTTVNDDGSVAVRLAGVKTRGPVNRTQADHDFLLANDKKLAEITAQGKSPDRLTADELDYVQKATGLVNTFANLSPAEKALYDKAVASGDTEAAEGIAQIALIRTGGSLAGGANGTTYNPLATAITAANIEQYFSHSIIDPSGNATSKFQALIRFVQSTPSV